MKNPGFVIALVTAYLVFFVASPYLGVPGNIIIFMFAFSPVMVLYMVYVVLRYGKASGNTFEERFYDDVEV